MPIAYSYVRFSSAGQEGNDSVRRQIEKAEEYCHRHKLTLSTETFRDLGVSAWKGKNALIGNLGEFLHAVQSGRVAKGSTLIVEHIDRISRAGADRGLDLIKQIIRAGVSITTLNPERTYGPEALHDPSQGLFEIILALWSAAKYSDGISERVSAAMGEKQRRVAAGEKERFHLPAWLRWTGAGFEEIPEKAATVRRVFNMAVQGHGAGVIARILNQDGTPPLTGRRHWSRSSIHKLLSSEAVLGVYVPHRLKDGKRQQSGEAQKDYYPRIIDEDTYLSAQASIRSRLGSGGKPVNGVGVNVFAGLLFDARDGSKMRILGKRTVCKVIASSEAVETKKGYVSFPLQQFEAAVFSLLSEIDVEALLDNPEAQGQGDSLQVLQGRLALIEKELEGIRKSLARRWDEDIDARLDRVKKDRADLQEHLKAKENEGRHPTEEAWVESKRLIQIMLEAKDKTEFRTRLRAAIKRTVARIEVLPVSVSTAVRLAVVTVSFVGSTKKRQMFIASRAGWKNAGGSRPATWACGTAIYHESEEDTAAGFYSIGADHEMLEATIAQWYGAVKDKPGWNELPLKFPMKVWVLYCTPEQADDEACLALFHLLPR